MLPTSPVTMPARMVTTRIVTPGLPMYTMAAWNTGSPSIPERFFKSWIYAYQSWYPSGTEDAASNASAI